MQVNEDKVTDNQEDNVASSFELIDICSNSKLRKRLAKCKSDWHTKDSVPSFKIF